MPVAQASHRHIELCQQEANRVLGPVASLEPFFAVRDWLAAHPRVTIHYTPTYSSWLNQVELWFAKIERDYIARGIFTSITDLRRKLMQYIRLHNKTYRPFQWAYRSPKHRIRTSAA